MIQCLLLITNTRYCLPFASSQARTTLMNKFSSLYEWFTVRENDLFPTVASGFLCRLELTGTVTFKRQLRGADNAKDWISRMRTSSLTGGIHQVETRSYDKLVQLGRCGECNLGHSDEQTTQKKAKNEMPRVRIQKCSHMTPIVHSYIIHSGDDTQIYSMYLWDLVTLAASLPLPGCSGCLIISLNWTRISLTFLHLPHRSLHLPHTVENL